MPVEGHRARGVGELGSEEQLAVAALVHQDLGGGRQIRRMQRGLERDRRDEVGIAQAADRGRPRDPVLDAPGADHQLCLAAGGLARTQVTAQRREARGRALAVDHGRDPALETGGIGWRGGPRFEPVGTTRRHRAADRKQREPGEHVVRIVALDQHPLRADVLPTCDRGLEAPAIELRDRRIVHVVERVIVRDRHARRVELRIERPMQHDLAARRREPRHRGWHRHERGADDDHDERQPLSSADPGAQVTTLQAIAELRRELGHHRLDRGAVCDDRSLGGLDQAVGAQREVDDLGIEHAATGREVRELGARQIEAAIAHELAVLVHPLDQRREHAIAQRRARDVTRGLVVRARRPRDRPEPERRAEGVVHRGELDLRDHPCARDVAAERREAEERG